MYDYEIPQLKSVKPHPTKYHSTNDELFYIETIGMHSEHTRNMSRLELLENYLDATKKRVKWDDRNKLDILVAIQKEIKAEKKK